MKTIEFTAPLVSLKDLAETLENRLNTICRARKTKFADYDSMIADCTDESIKAELLRKRRFYDATTYAKLVELKDFAESIGLVTEERLFDAETPYKVHTPLAFNPTVKF